MLYNYKHLQCHALFVIVVDIVVTLYFAVSWHSVVLCLLVWVMPSNIWSFRLPIHLLTCQKNRYSAETFTQPKITDWGTMSNITHCTEQPAVAYLFVDDVIVNYHLASSDYLKVMFAALSFDFMFIYTI